MKTIDVFSAKKVSPQLTQKYLEKGINLESRDLIETQILPLEDLSKRKQVDAYIFTSQRAVFYFDQKFQREEDFYKPVFCVGEKTAKGLSEKGFKNLKVAKNAKDLLEIIRKENFVDFRFFGSKQRLDTLSEGLLEMKKNLDEVFLYQTFFLPFLLEKTYEAYLFYSPSGVDSFFVNNQIPASSRVFALGDSTKKALEKHQTSPLILAKDTSVEAMLETVKEYYDKK